MIKIRYAELPTGLHIQTLAQGRDTVLYLLPGLTAAERRAAIQRVKSNSRVGHGPPLPAAGVAVALVVDRMRTTLGNGLGAMRMHPSFFVPVAVVVASVAAAYLLLASVTIQFRQPQASGPHPGVIGAGPALSTASPGPARHPAGVPGPSAGQQPGGGPGGHHPAPRPTPTRSASPSPSVPITPEPTSSPPPSGPAPAPSSSVPPSPTPTPSPAPTPSPSRLCVNVGPLGVCLRA